MKRRMTIQFPSLNLVDDDGRHWYPFDESERFYNGETGPICDECEDRTWRGFKRGVTHKPASMSYLCPACIELINPWEHTS